MESQLLLPAFYLPPVSYFHIIQQTDQPILLERFEHYPKQSYRTRTKIATANGTLDLIVPIIHGRKEHVPMKDIRINYEFDWQRLHWLSLQTAYRSSAYFEYYEDDFLQFYNKRHDFLFDFNRSLLLSAYKSVAILCPRRHIILLGNRTISEGKFTLKKRAFGPLLSPITRFSQKSMVFFLS